MQDKKNKKLKMVASLDKRAGFTLVELLVVMAIASIMSSVVFVSFKPAKDSTQLNLSQREVAAVIKLAQGYAIQGRTQLIGGEQKVPCGYGFRFTSNTDFQIFYNKPSAGKDCQEMATEGDPSNYRYNANSVVLESFSLKKDVALSSPPFASSGAYFSTPNAVLHDSTGTLFPTDSESYVLQSQGLEKSIGVNRFGSITEN